MRAVVTGDWHIGISTHGVQEEDGVNSRTRDVVRAAEEIIDYAIANRVDRFIHLGDVWHRNHPNPTDMALAIQLFNKLERAQIYTFVLAGNHDYVHGPRCDATEALSNVDWKYVKFFSDPTVIDDHGVRWLICPHTKKKQLEAFLDDINIYSGDRQNIVLCHTMFQGCIVGSEDTMMSTGVQMIPRDMSVDAIFSGHIHKSQILERQGCATVYHPGSPVCMDFGERHDAKEFIDADVGGASGSKIGTTWVPVKYKRKFIHLDSLMLVDWPDLTGAIVRVEAEKSIVSVEDIENEIKRRGAHAVASIKLLTNEEMAILEHNLTEMTDDKTLMANFLRERCPEHFEKAWNAAWQTIAATQ